jgi:hypothetical protein
MRGIKRRDNENRLSRCKKAESGMLKNAIQSADIILIHVNAEITGGEIHVQHVDYSEEYAEPPTMAVFQHARLLSCRIFVSSKCG